jgi:ATP-dependent Clp protease adaptor protein ClpS
MAQNDAPRRDDRDQVGAAPGGGTTLVTRPASPRTRRLPPWNVILHNDDVNDMGYVVETIVALAALSRHVAILRMLEAHTQGIALLVSTHLEHAELLQEQFHSRRLTVTIEESDG